MGFSPRLGDLRLPEINLEQGPERAEERPRFALTNCTAFIGATSTNLLLDLMERTGPLERFLGDRRRATVGDLVEERPRRCAQQKASITRPPARPEWLDFAPKQSDSYSVSFPRLG